MNTSQDNILRGTGGSIPYRGAPNAINSPPLKDQPKILAKLEQLNKALAETEQRLAALEEKLQSITYPQDRTGADAERTCSPVFVMGQLDTAVFNIESLNRRIENLITSCYL